MAIAAVAVVVVVVVVVMMAATILTRIPRVVYTRCTRRVIRARRAAEGKLLVPSGPVARDNNRLGRTDPENSGVANWLAWWETMNGFRAAT